ncbi:MULTISPECIES: RNB domain-containing ribonuclease [Actinomyces]|uniref:RNB domain-containing ribonuclease n=1 Tax=Actinomyces respiraculi TaxID=2744574 RepID=A0A7T0LKA0_9ACTO|nr:MULTISPECIES: RNB domain-containing ribonuclease [Actinomyces]QPL05172.1 RNB domain-containing ribonuclease [Actinomyces respiraculi]
MPRARISTYTAPPAAVVSALDDLRAAHDVPAVFPQDALREARAAAAAWDDDGAERFLRDGHGDGVPVRDARDLPLVTIDPPGSMDLDQAVLLEHPAGGGYRVTYAIASLATFITPGGALDAELRRRGETVYAPDRSTPLHPEELSHGAASLLPDVDRPACLWTIDLDDDGAVTSAHVERALVRSHARLTYAEVQAAIDGQGTLPAAVPAGLPGLLREVGTLRQRQEAARGGVSLSTPEQEVTRTDEPGADGYRLAYRAALPVEEWNAQVSLLTGMCAARLMVEAGAGVLRTMPPAEARDYRRLRRIARALGVDWPETLTYPGLVRSLDASVPAHAAFMDQAAGLFRGAGYLVFGPGCGPAPSADGEAVHAAIASRYAHVTAPLRRLVDRYGEEACVAACAGAPVPAWVLEALPGLPDVMAETGRRSRAVERGAVSAIEALVLDGHVGEVFDGVLLSERDGRGEVMLAEPAVVGVVHADEASAGGAHGRALPVGEPVRVRLEEVDVAAGRIAFALVP